jgi:hypothetical protein
MRYAAVLNGQAEVFEKVAPCFDSDTARIKRLGDQWVLESFAFNACGEPPQVFPIADATLDLIHRILALYCGLCSPFTVAFIQEFNAEGMPSRRGIRGISTITIYSSRGIAELANQSGAQPLGSAIVERVASDDALNEALNLRGDQGLGWSQIYDIIEFLGGPSEIERAGWASKKRTRDIRQTANRYRHLGSPKNYPLPASPPTINEACIFASELLRRWIASRLH